VIVREAARRRRKAHSLIRVIRGFDGVGDPDVGIDAHLDLSILVTDNDRVPCVVLYIIGVIPRQMVLGSVLDHAEMLR